jgi:hypothetical protein
MIGCETVWPSSSITGESAMNIRGAVLLVLLGFVSGCANIGTVSRSTLLPDGGLAVHLDAPQRLVYANKDGKLCAEPTPDALQAYANAVGGGVGLSDKGAASLSNAFAANAQSVGLHTQSITLMRETLYRICEYSHNHGSDDLQVVQLLQRSQDLTLGVLAIEQLTGAVVARQAAMTADTGAASAASINNTQAQLDFAQKTEEAKKTALAVAKDQETGAKAALDALQAQLQPEQAKPADQQDAAKIADLTKKIPDQNAVLADATAATKTAELNYKQAADATKVIQSMLGVAMSASQASTTGSALFSDGGSTRSVDKETAKEIADATVDIVKSILNKGHLTDTCMNFLISHPGGPGDDARTKAVIEKCVAIIDADIKLASAGGGTLKNGDPAAGAHVEPTGTGGLGGLSNPRWLSEPYTPILKKVTPTAPAPARKPAAPPKK